MHTDPIAALPGREAALETNLSDVSSAPLGRLKATCRKIAASGLYHTGLLRVVQGISNRYELLNNPRRILPSWRRVADPKSVILCYHRVGTGGIPFFSEMSPTTFEAQVRYLRKHYRLVSFDQLWRDRHEARGVEQTVVITFDDGYRDLYTHAFPILQKYEVPATIFLVVDSVEKGEVPWYDRIFAAFRVAPGDELDLVLDRPYRFRLASPTDRRRAAWELVRYLRKLPNQRRREYCAALEKQVRPLESDLRDRMLNWEEIRIMQRAGISFGSHTLTHPVVSRLEPSEMEMELAESKRILEDRLDCRVEDFAYPFGTEADCAPQGPDVLMRLGYRSAVTTVCGVNTPTTNPYRLRRIQIGADPSIASLAFELNRLFLAEEPETAPEAGGKNFCGDLTALARSESGLPNERV